MTKEEKDTLYLNNYKRKSFQWELWSVCNNLCEFCYLGKDNRHTDKERQLTSLNDLKNMDCIIVSVAHESFKKLSIEDINRFFRNSENSCKVLIDVKGIFERDKLIEKGFTWWRL